MNTMRLITLLAALSGRPIRLSGIAAPDADPASVRVAASPAGQIRPGRATRAYRGIVYAEPGRALRMDILVPRAPGPHPLVLYVPGGGFVTARRQMAGRQRRYVAEAGFVVAAVEYRTVRDGATYRDGVADVAAALDFLLLHAGRYWIDASRIGVWGESAGGYLAAMTGVIDARVGAVVDAFGASNLATVAEGFDATTVAAFTGPGTALPAYLLGPGGDFANQPAEVAAADPVSHVSESAPPFLLLHGDDDRIVAPAQTARLHQALRRAGADSTRYVLEGAGHGALSATANVWTGTQVMTIIVDFLRSRLGGRA